MTRVLKTGFSALAAALVTFVVLLLLAAGGIYNAAMGTAVGLPLVMGFIAGQAVWKKAADTSSTVVP